MGGKNFTMYSRGGRLFLVYFFVGVIFYALFLRIFFCKSYITCYLIEV